MKPSANSGTRRLLLSSQLEAETYKYLGQGDGQATATVWAAAAQVHATLALSAATTLNHEIRRRERGPHVCFHYHRNDPETPAGGVTGMRWIDAMVLVAD